MSLNYPAVEELEASWHEAARENETATAKPKPLLDAIEEAEARGDRSAVIALVKQVDWRKQHPDELLRAINACMHIPGYGALSA